MTEVLNKLIAHSAKRYGADPTTLAAGDDIFEKLKIDSFQAVELMSELELEFDVEIPDYELQGVNTFGGLAEVIAKRT